MKPKPNILFIISDQHRYDCIGTSNKYPVITPNIDRIASEGMWFNNAYTPIPICCPARQSLLCGRRSESFGALWNYDITLPIPALPPSSYTWVKQLKTEGYQNILLGKWHINPDFGPLDFGFDKYIKPRNLPNKNGFFGGESQVGHDETNTWWLAENAIKEIEDSTRNGEEKPWNMMLSFDEPHLPCNTIKEFADLYAIDDIPKWDGFDDTFKDKPYIQRQQLVNWNTEKMSWEDWAPSVRNYYAVITQMDAAIGKVLDKLDELGIADNTIVIYTSDHGDMCGSHKMLDKHYVLYEDVTHVPLVVKYPGVIPKNTKTSAYSVHFLDIAPTILELCGLEKPEGVEFHGRSLMNILKTGGVIPQGWRDEAVTTYNGQQFGLYTQRSIVSHEWKYVWNLTDVDELYNLHDDPGELHNLMPKKLELSEILADLRLRLYNTLCQEDDRLVIYNGRSWIKAQLLEGRKL